MNYSDIENQKIVRKIRGKFRKAVAEYGLIKDGDHILIGLSGGKDSLALTMLLGEKMKLFSPRFKVSAAHVRVESVPYASDLEYLKDFSEKNGIPFFDVTTDFSVDEEIKKPICFLCSWNRRKALFELAKKIGCNKIALGHHLDDAVETLLLNLVYQGAFATMPPKLKMDKFDMTIIRPLTLISEADVLRIEEIYSFKKQFKNCPHEKESSRAEAKKLIRDLEKWNPDVRQSIWHAMENIKRDYLPNKIDTLEL